MGTDKTALWLASGKGYENLVRILLDRGADVNMQNQDGVTALQRATRFRHESICRLLVDKGAEDNIPWLPLTKDPQFSD